MKNTSLRAAIDYINKISHKIDSSSVSPSSLAYAAWKLRLKQRKSQAMRDPLYAAEEKARKKENGIAVVSGEGFTVKSYFDHLKLFDELAPSTFVDTLLLNASNNLKVTTITALLTDNYDKLTKGWTESEVWSMSHSLATRTGSMLIELADTAHGWPDRSYGTFEEWVEALRENGNKLIAYGKQEGVGAMLYYLDLEDEKERIKARKEAEELENKLSENARQAWMWIATHHEDLWD